LIGALAAARNVPAAQIVVKKGSGAPSVGLNTTFTFWSIFSAVRSQSTKLVCSDGPSFSVDRYRGRSGRS